MIRVEKMRCPKCCSDMRKVLVKVAGAKVKAVSHQCGSCGYFEFEQDSSKKICYRFPRTARNEPKLSRWAITQTDESAELKTAYALNPPLKRRGLAPFSIKQIENSRKSIAKGQYVTHEEMKRRLGL